MATLKHLTFLWSRMGRWIGLQKLSDLKKHWAATANAAAVAAAACRWMMHVAVRVSVSLLSGVKFECF